MITKHFFKILFIFTSMIALGLIGVILISHFDKNLADKENKLNAEKNKTQVAK